MPGRPSEEEILEMKESRMMSTWNKIRLDDMRNQSRRDFEGTNEADPEEEIADF